MRTNFRHPLQKTSRLVRTHPIKGNQNQNVHERQFQAAL